MSLYKPTKSPFWWINLPNPHGGPRIRESTKVQHEGRKKPCKRAQEIHDQRQAELWEVKTSGRTFYDALNAWLSVKQRSITQINSVEQIRRMYPNRPLAKVSGDSVLAVFANRKKQQRPNQIMKETKAISAGTYNKHANIIRAALYIAKEKKWVDQIDKIPRKAEPKGKAKFITKEQVETLISKLAEHQKPLFMFSLATGLRWSNATYLEWDRVDLRRKIAWIDGEDTKGGEDIPVPLSTEAVAVLEGQIGKDATWVFPYRGLPIASPKTAFNRARKEAGLEHFNWHAIRHTWASWHVMAGTPLEVLQELGKWKDPEMVQRYAKLAPGYVATFADNAKPYETNVVDIQKRKKA